MFENQAWSIRMADSVLKSYPDLSDKWDHEYGVVFKSIEDVWHKTKDRNYFDYLESNIKSRIAENGDIAGYALEDYSVDHINTGRILFTLYDETRDERYRRAATILRNQFKTHPRTSEGILWHKKIFPYQSFLDGIYMASPFYAQYAKTFNEPEIFEDVIDQIILLAKHSRDATTGLFYHGWDEKKEQIWANPQTGCSPSFWGRSGGWYCVGIVDVLDYLPENHPKRGRLIEILSGFLTSIVKYQDSETGVWYQVVDQGDREGNYLESSSSNMYTYALAKGIRKGYLSDGFLPALKRSYQGILKNFIEVDNDGTINLHQTCKTAGLGITDNRDGSFEYYISEPVVSNDFKGLGTFIMASVEVELIRELVQM
ncbi:glycoside hydrolase family 88/105 protein [Bacillus sinesaloumensis]|uniref:glycoside hydrolase family 88/105 protein n=1 Tax=Litchfieldia sinesaloumensis TaxID=1926280 RepID=UPI00190E8460|nr:glycoside hydrolase family 88 protein [Bacillus sinesaloumensis]